MDFISCFTLVNGDLRENLKKEGYLKRDPRAKERRKFGLKKLVKAPQWNEKNKKISRGLFYLLIKNML